MLTSNKGRVKFISYTGEFPNLCSGVLTLEIDGKEYKFGHDSRNLYYDEKTNKWTHTDEDPENPNFDSFWYSGGCVTGGPPDWNFNVDQGEWEISIEDLPDQFLDLAAEIITVFNENVRQGCCGGCI